ncbi:MAG: glycosyltransferase family 39 protein [Candidatus Omnitrophica bacterium]|nr:glycosyltransferase family 39 protein [Candidatus Omnitrophota bacterium]
MTFAVKRNLIFSVIVLAIGLRLICLDKSFQGDEFLSVQHAMKSVGDIAGNLLADAHPPLYFYLLHAVMRFPWSEEILRLLSVIAGVGMCIAVYMIGKRAMEKEGGLVAAFLVAIAPVTVWSSQYIRTYATAAFFTVFSIYFLMRIMRKEAEEFPSWALFVFFSAASIYTFYFSALVIVAENVFVALFMREDKGFLKKWALSQIFIAALYLPWIPFFIYQRAVYTGHPQLVERIGFYIGNIHIGALIRSLLGIVGFDPRFLAKEAMSAHDALKYASLAGMLISSLAATLLAAKYIRSPKFTRDERKYAYFFLILAAVPFAIAIFLHQAVKIVLMSHYFIASFVFLVLFLVAACRAVLSEKAQYLLLAAVSAVFLSRLVFLYADKEMDLKGAHAYAKAVATRETAIVSPSFGGSFKYYFYDMPNLHQLEDPDVRRIADREIVFISYPEKLESRRCHERFNSFLNGRYTPVDSKKFGDLTVQRYRKL